MTARRSRRRAEPPPVDPAALLEAHVTTLVQEAPVLDPGVVEHAAGAALAAAARGADEPARLALALERVIDDLGAGEIALAVGLPAAAMAAATLQRAVAAGAADDPLAVRGALYELETMFPVPSTGRRPTLADPTPDVPIGRLTTRVAPPARRPDRAAGARARRVAAIAVDLGAEALARLAAARARYDR